MRDGYLRGARPPQPTPRQVDVLAAFVTAGGSVAVAADIAGIRPSTVKRHLADLRARTGLTTEQLIYCGLGARLACRPDVGVQLKRDSGCTGRVRSTSGARATGGAGYRGVKPIGRLSIVSLASAGTPRPRAPARRFPDRHPIPSGHASVADEDRRDDRQHECEVRHFSVSRLSLTVPAKAPRRAVARRRATCAEMGGITALSAERRGRLQRRAPRFRRQRPSRPTRCLC